MERPFTPRERRGLIDVCEWLFHGQAENFLPGTPPLPDDDPYTLINDWRSWVEECLVLMDGDGRLRHLPYPGTYREQPDYDMSVHQVIRGAFNRMQNEKIREQIAATRSKMKG